MNSPQRSRLHGGANLSRAPWHSRGVVRCGGGYGSELREARLFPKRLPQMERHSHACSRGTYTRTHIQRKNADTCGKGDRRRRNVGEIVLRTVARTPPLLAWGCKRKEGEEEQRQRQRPHTMFPVGIGFQSSSHSHRRFKCMELRNGDGASGAFSHSLIGPKVLSCEPTRPASPDNSERLMSGPRAVHPASMMMRPCVRAAQDSHG